MNKNSGINEEGKFDPGLARSRYAKVVNQESTNLDKLSLQLNDPGLRRSRGLHRQLKPSLIYAFRRRQRDIGWGYALAHLIPFVGLFYAFSRRTVTPILYQLASGFVFAFIIVASTFNSQVNNSIISFVNILSLISTPILSKLGIDNARKYAYYKLQNLEENSPSDTENKTLKGTKIKSKIKSTENNNQEGGIEFELNKVKDLLDRGVISESEHQAMRKKVLGI